MALIVTGYVDGEPIYFEEPEPTQYEATTDVEEKPQYEVGIAAEDEHGNVNSVHSIFLRRRRLDRADMAADPGRCRLCSEAEQQDCKERMEQLDAAGAIRLGSGAYRVS